MKAQGMSQIEIAHKLMVSDSAIGNDVQYLREQAKEDIHKYATDFLPSQFQICLAALDIIIKRAYQMISTAKDHREELLAMEMFQNAHTQKLELLSSATTIDSALEFIRHRRQQQQQEEPQQLVGANSDNNGADEDKQATIF
jgi:hypothetical protein